MTITLMADPRVQAAEVLDNGEPLVPLDPMFGTLRPGNLVRSGLAVRLMAAYDALPDGIGLRVVEGFRTASAQAAIITSYGDRLRISRPELSAGELALLISRYVAPLAVAPHVAGAAVDLTLVDSHGDELWLGSALDATPEESHGACFFDAAGLDPQARAHRALMARVLGDVGLVNYPTEWWHWSFGDRYWAVATGANHAVYDSVDALRLSGVSA